MNKAKVYPWYFAAVSVLLFVVLSVVPGLMGIGYSFTDWSAYGSDISFVGFDNFKEVFSGNNEYLRYITNTILFTVVTVVVKTVLGLVFAVILAKNVRFKNFHRAILYLPAVLPILVTGLTFKSILNPKMGFLNTLLRAIGLDSLALNWLTDAKLALGSVIMVDIWRGTGYIMTLFIVAILAIPKDYYEASAIDGSNGWQQFRYITLPGIRQTVSVVVVLNTIYGLKVFDIVYALTNGGPGTRTEVLYTSVYKLMARGLYAQATAMSSVLFIFMLIVGYFMIKILTRNEVVE